MSEHNNGRKCKWSCAIGIAPSWDNHVQIWSSFRCCGHPRLGCFKPLLKKQLKTFDSFHHSISDIKFSPFFFSYFLDQTSRSWDTWVGRSIDQDWRRNTTLVVEEMWFIDKYPQVFALVIHRQISSSFRFGTFSCTVSDAISSVPSE